MLEGLREANLSEVKTTSCSQTGDRDLARLLNILMMNRMSGDGVADEGYSRVTGGEEEEEEEDDAMEGLFSTQSTDRPPSRVEGVEEVRGGAEAELIPEDEGNDPQFSQNSVDGWDWNDDMIYGGDDYSVQLYRNIVVHHEDRIFDGGVVTECIYKVHFDRSWRNKSLQEIFGRLTAVIEEIIEKLRVSYAPRDLVRFYISNPAFFSPQCIGLIPLEELTIGLVMAHLEQILQTNL